MILHDLRPSLVFIFTTTCVACILFGSSTATFGSPEKSQPEIGRTRRGVALVRPKALQSFKKALDGAKDGAQVQSKEKTRLGLDK